MNTQPDIILIGSGIGSLSAAALLASKGYKCLILEQNWLPGGCASSYPRKHYIFESGATTLVGLDENMPLHYLFSQTGIKFNAIRLDIPMEVYLRDGQKVTRYEDLDSWIAEAERVFGPEGQRPFWEYCYNISQKVWETSSKQRAFPPASFRDLLEMARNFRFSQLPLLSQPFNSMADLLKRFGLEKHQLFREFVDEQLLITAQNTAEEVNVLFGATALCYTNYGNFYVNGGMMGLVKAITEYLESKGSQILLRTSVTGIHRTAGGYKLETKKSGDFFASKLISGIPINNTLGLMNGYAAQVRKRHQLMDSGKLWSAFQMGIAFKSEQVPACLHHQIHLDEPLPFSGSHSIFVSLSHPSDNERAPEGEYVASISTHIPDPEKTIIEDKDLLEEMIVGVLESKGLLKKENIIFQHSSTPKSWKKWTGREWGFVGGYPQFLSLKPWQMNEARLDGKAAYLCGDTAYPGQGIPGASLSGIIAAEKLILDHGTPS